MPDSLAQYRASVKSCQEAFFEQHRDVPRAFQTLDVGFAELAAILREARDANNKTHVSLVPFLFLMRRQSFAAFDALSVHQSYQGWLVIRPAIESALIMGKWIEDVANFHIWEKRHIDPGAYRRAYSGTALRSSVLPDSARLQTSLKAINDSFVHPNPEYYQRHLRLGRLDDGGIQMEMRFFDDDSVLWASVLGLLHLLITAQTTVAKMFAAKFVNVSIAPERFGLAEFRNAHRDQATEAAKAGRTEATIIRDLGLWDL